MLFTLLPVSGDPARRQLLAEVVAHAGWRVAPDGRDPMLDAVIVDGAHPSHDDAPPHVRRVVVDPDAGASAFVALIERELAVRLGSLQVGPRLVDLDDGRVHGVGGTSHLTDRELDVLRLLATRAGKAVPKDEIVSAVWGKATDAALHQTVKRLREKLEDDPATPRHILAVHGVGYRLLGSPAEPPTVPVRRPSGLVAARHHVARPALEAELAERLTAPGWTTLLGPGGSGKTQLALCCLPSSAVLADLSGCRTAHDVATLLAGAVGLSRSDPARVSGVLGLSAAPVLLDNCEQLDEDALDWLAPVASTVAVVATSRRALRIPGEQLLEVGTMAQDEALALWSAWTGRTPAPEDLTLLTLFERLPLAVVLGATRARTMAASDLLAAAAEPLRLLRDPSRPGGRHGSMRAAVGWSWELLQPDERTALGRLVPFEGGFSRALAHRVLGDGDADWSLARLADHSLVTFDPTTWRFRILEVVREAVRELSAPDVVAEDRTRHVDVMATWSLEKVSQHFEGVPIRVEVLAEADNLRAAHRAATGMARDHVRLGQALVSDLLGHRGQELAALLADLDLPFGSREHAAAAYWRARATRAQGLSTTDRMLGIAEEAVFAAQWPALGRWLALEVGLHELLHGSVVEARATLEPLVQGAYDRGDRLLLARAGTALGSAMVHAGDAAAYEVLYERTRAAKLASGDPRELISAELSHAHDHFAWGRASRAYTLARTIEHAPDAPLDTRLRATVLRGVTGAFVGLPAPDVDLARAESLARAAGLDLIVFEIRQARSIALSVAGHHVEALDLLDQARAMTSDPATRATAQVFAATCATKLGQLDRARRDLAEGRAWLLEAGLLYHRQPIARAEGLLHCAEGNHAEAVPLFREAYATRLGLLTGLAAMLDEAEALQFLGRRDEAAEVLARTAVEFAQAELPDASPLVVRWRQLGGTPPGTP